MTQAPPTIYLERATGEDTAAEAHVMSAHIGQITIFWSVCFNLLIAGVIFAVGPIAGRFLAMLPAFPYQPIITTGLYVLAVAAPLLNALYQIVFIATARITITTQRLQFSTGVFSRSDSNVELFRVRDITVTKPLLTRVFRRGDLRIWSTDASDRYSIMSALKKPNETAELLRTLAARSRQAHGVRVVE